MLTGSVVTTILQVSEAAPAVEFYRDRLGLGYLGRNKEGQEIFALGGGASLALMPDPGATGRAAQRSPSRSPTSLRRFGTSASVG